MTIHKENHETTHTPAPAPSTAFPANVEPKGRKIFGPAPSPHQPAKENVFNTDKFGTRAPKDS